MPRILISYRREDSAAYAGRIYDHLSQHFGAENVFMDVTTITSISTITATNTRTGPSTATATNLAIPAQILIPTGACPRSSA